MGGLLAFAAMVVTADASSSASVEPGPIAVDGGVIADVPVDSRGLRVFRGIPYAAPAVGALRWRAPAPVEPWPGIRQADRFGALCPQPDVFGIANELRGVPTEDCLNLHVWTPARSSRERLPVLVWIHGGAYVVGGGSWKRNDGAGLAARGLVVVAINYRLGVFGFLAHPELTSEAPHQASGNYGLLDQIAALHWVQRNIKAFGGDPTRVTIGGASSGATSVNILMVSPLAKGLFHRAIAHAGSAMSVSAPNDGSPLPRAIEERKGMHFARSLGVQSVSELRALPADALVKASGAEYSTWGWNASIDGHVLPAPPAEFFLKGQQNDVPLLVGWNANEGAAIGRATFGGDEERFAEQIAKRFGSAASDVLRLYPASSREEERASKAALAGEGFIAYPAWTWAVAQSSTGKQPVFVFKFEHAPPVPPGYGADTMLGAPGAFHGAEVPYLFGAFSHYPDWSFAPADRRISEQMQAYWARFIGSGDPNAAGSPTWPAYAGADPHRLHIDARGLHVLRDSDREQFEALGRLAASVPGSLSYRGMNAERWK